ncbi:MAG: hypothetical protein PVF70_00695 [Anaerolineales bacterium]|jgi:hypothetical protein
MRIGLQPGMVEWLDPAAPEKLSSLFLQEGWGGVLSLQVEDMDAYVTVAPAWDAFREIDVSHPSASVVQRDFESPWDPMGMRICEDRLHMSSADGLWIYDLAEPALPGLLAWYSEWQDFNALPLPDDTL